MPRNYATGQNSAEGPLTGQCRHCEWFVVESSYAKIVKAYQDHLREKHPKAWLRL